jgi:pyrophosphate--fructose-6-phosphate 1-phosphotransferase
LALIEDPEQPAHPWVIPPIWCNMAASVQHVSYDIFLTHLLTHLLVHYLLTLLTMASESTPSFPGPVRVQGRQSFSALQGIGRRRALLLPSTLAAPPASLRLSLKEALGAVDDHEHIQQRFPATYGRPRVLLEVDPSASVDGGEGSKAKAMRVGVILSGGQAPGGHNVISGIYDFIKKVSPESQMVGFLNGPQGLYNAEYCFVDDEMMDSFRNSGGFDMIGSGRHKIEKPEHFKASMETCIALQLDGVVIIGGDDSNTNGAVLAEYFEANQCATKVCGAPKTIDGDLKVDPYIPISFGFDTACRTYSELIGNVCQDTLSSQKYYHFVRLMGRAASNIALECALQTRPNVCLISEEVEAKQSTLIQITKEVVDVILQRSENSKKNYGVVLLPEGLIEFLPEFNNLISDINEVLAAGTVATEEAVMKVLAPANQEVFSYLPDNIKQQLLLDRDPHGNVQVAKIETEKLLAQTVATELAKLAKEGKYTGQFSPQFHSYGYEGRSCIPSAFDATYCYALGQNVAALLAQGECNN